MILSSALLLVLVGLSLGMFCLRYRHRLNHSQQMTEGLQYIKLAEKVLEHLPQHRGIANTLLNGDNTLQQKITELQQTLTQDIAAIDTFTASHTIHPDLQSRWQTIKSGWEALKQELNSLTAGASFERHSALIGEILYLISDAADRMSLTNHPDPTVRKIILVSFNLLPPIIENIGQARGIGSGAAAKGTLLTAVRIKLEFLHERLNNNTNTVFSTIEKSLKLNSSCQINRDSINNSQQQIRHFLETISTHLLSGKITISAADYFNEGTAAFNSNLLLLSTISSTLQQQINSTISPLKSKLLWSITLSVGTTILLMVAWWSLATT